MSSGFRGGAWYRPGICFFVEFRYYCPHMAITSSAKKALRASLKKRVFNVRRKNTMRDAFKDFSKLVAGKKAKEAGAMISAVYQSIDKATKRGIIKQNAASRRKSRVARMLAGISK